MLKLRKRPATWILGIIWLAFLTLFAYILPYILFTNLPTSRSTEDVPPEVQAQQKAAVEQQIEQLSPERFVSLVVSNSSSIGAPIALILGALAVGSEYGWGTLKTVLSQRPGRLGAFFAKVLGLGALLVLFVVLGLVAAAVCSLFIAGLQGATVDWPPLVELLEGFGASATILAVWAALGVLLATLFRSTVLATGLGLFYALALEGIIFSLPIPNESFQNARRFFLGQNSSFLANSLTGGSLPQNLTLSTPEVGAIQATLVLFTYLAVFLLIAALVFQSRDVA